MDGGKGISPTYPCKGAAWVGRITSAHLFEIADGPHNGQQHRTAAYDVQNPATKGVSEVAPGHATAFPPQKASAVANFRR